KHDRHGDERRGDAPQGPTHEATPSRASARPSGTTFGAKGRRRDWSARWPVPLASRVRSAGASPRAAWLARRAHSCGTAPVSDRTSPPRRACPNDSSDVPRPGWAERRSRDRMARRTLRPEGGAGCGAGTDAGRGARERRDRPRPLVAQEPLDLRGELVARRDLLFGRGLELRQDRPDVLVVRDSGVQPFALGSRILVERAEGEPDLQVPCEVLEEGERRR